MNNIELAKELILNNFSFLEEMGYIVSTELQKSKVFLESVGINYHY